ncbi:MAG TPA: hypothetical protein VFE31_08635, partial [Opitutaceae bacterium]|nr:hypothetical protein [Opitutaceae bacterium]
AKGFISRLVLRDALYAAFRGLGDIVQETGKKLGELLGMNLDLSIGGMWKWIGDKFANNLTGIPGIRGLLDRQADQNMAKLRTDEQQRIQLERWKADPATFGKSSADVEREIEALHAAQLDVALKHQQYNKNRAAEAVRDNPANYGSAYERFKASQEPRPTLPNDGGINDEVLATITKQNEERMKILEAELAIAREKERIQKEDQRGVTEFQKSAAEADKSREQRDVAHERLIERNHREHLLETEATEAQAARGPAERDLRLSEHLLSRESATSAVVVHGAIYGRNDSAAALVQHAQQQLSVLRGIENKLEQIRREKSELTLL